jgi:hypothetical protein
VNPYVDQSVLKGVSFPRPKSLSIIHEVFLTLYLSLLRMIT